MSNSLFWASLIGIYGLIVAIGGIIGYQKARSTVSLVSGLGSGVVLAIAAVQTLTQPVNGLLLATAIAVLLLIVFSIRWLKTRALMPAGVMTILSLIATVLFAIAAYRLV